MWTIIFVVPLYNARVRIVRAPSMASPSNLIARSWWGCVANLSHPTEAPANHRRNELRWSRENAVHCHKRLKFNEN